MMVALRELFAAGVTVAACVAVGYRVLRRFAPGLAPGEARLLAFVPGGACLGPLFYALAWAGWARPGVVTALQLACIVASVVYWKPLNDLLGRFQRALRVDVSYGLYILHYPLIVGLLKLQLSGWVRLPPALGMALMMALTYAIAVVLHKIVELPAIRLGRHLTRKAPTI